VIAGAKRPAQLIGNLGAPDVELTTEDLVSRLLSTYPGWIQAGKSWRFPQPA
jgi:hypothetical protein